MSVATWTLHKKHQGSSDLRQTMEDIPDRTGKTPTKDLKRQNWNNLSESQGRTKSSIQVSSRESSLGILIHRLSHQQVLNKVNKSNKFQVKIWRKKPPIHWNVLHHCDSLFLQLLHFQLNVIIDVMKDCQFPSLHNLIIRMLRIWNEKSRSKHQQALILHQV